MTLTAKTDSLFQWIEAREHKHLNVSNSSWGRVLDAGTGRHSLTWLLRGEASVFVQEVVAVTGENPLAADLLAEFGSKKTPSLTLHVGNWQHDAFLSNEKPFDVIIAGKQTLCGTDYGGLSNVILSLWTRRLLDWSD